MLNKITSLVLIASMSVAASSATAGGMAEPIVEPEVIIEDTASSAGILVPLLLLVLVIAAASSSSGGGLEPSDMRLKTEITRVGTAANGLPLYQFRYIGYPALYQGVMAQDVLAYMPEAVGSLPGGYMSVNYKMLGLEMHRVH